MKLILMWCALSIVGVSHARAQEEGSPRDGADKQTALTSSDRLGSGFFISHDGYFVTNHHVIDGASRVSVLTRGATYRATIVRSDALNDLALLKVDGESFQALHVRDCASVRPGDRVFTVGYPDPIALGQAAKFSSGDVAALSGLEDDHRSFQISVPIQPGNSGGPLVDQTGGVIGIITSKRNWARALQDTFQLPENVNYAVKSSLLLTLIESVPELAGKLAPHPDTIVEGQPAPQPAAIADPWSDRIIDIRFRGGSIGDYLNTLREATAPETVNVIAADDVLRLKANPVTLQRISVRTAVFLLASPALTPEPLTVAPTDAGPDAPPVYLVTPREPASRQARPDSPAAAVEPATGMVLVDL